ncbi:MAG: rRNA maturation RNase YbeY [Marinifilaceae bacterium]
MSEILFYTEGVEFPSFFSEDRVVEWIDEIADTYDKTAGEMSFIFCNDDHILEINKQYLDHDYYTDVITFDYCVGNLLCGDIFISLDTVASNAEQFGVPFEEEFHRVVAHSVLHLAGFKDKTDEEAAVMRENENKCLEILKEIE